MSEHITRDELNTHHERLLDAINRVGDGINDRLDAINGRVRTSEVDLGVLKDRSNRMELQQAGAAKRAGGWSGAISALVSAIVSGLMAAMGAGR